MERTISDQEQLQHTIRHARARRLGVLRETLRDIERRRLRRLRGQQDQRRISPPVWDREYRRLYNRRLCEIRREIYQRLEPQVRALLYEQLPGCTEFTLNNHLEGFTGYLFHC